MKTLYEKMRDNRFKALQREAIRRYHEDAKRQAKAAEMIRLTDSYYKALQVYPEICKVSKI